MSSLRLTYDDVNKVFTTKISGTTENVVCVTYGDGALDLVFPSGWTLDPQGFGTVRGTTVSYPDRDAGGTTKATKGADEVEIKLTGGQD
ncbi:MAG: hypothetical protein AAGA54_02160 [Myxococcota bacterium]